MDNCYHSIHIEAQPTDKYLYLMKFWTGHNLQLEVQLKLNLQLTILNRFVLEIMKHPKMISVDLQSLKEWPLIPIHIDLCERTGNELTWSTMLLTKFARLTPSIYLNVCKRIDPKIVLPHRGQLLKLQSTVSTE